MPTNENVGALIVILVIWVVLKLLKVAVRLMLFFIFIAAVLWVVYHFMR